MNEGCQLHTKTRQNVVMNYINNTSYDVYLNKKDSNNTSSVLNSEPKSNTFFNTGKVIIGSAFRVTHKPVMDNDAVVLQIALLQHSRERKYFWSDLALQIMLVAVCLWCAVSLVIWGAV